MSDIGTCIYSSYDSFETARIVAAFEDAEIPVYIKETGIGQWLNIIAGMSRTETKIYVPEEAADQALDILADMGLIESTEN